MGHGRGHVEDAGELNYLRGQAADPRLAHGPHRQRVPQRFDPAAGQVQMAERWLQEESVAAEWRHKTDSRHLCCRLLRYR